MNKLHILAWGFLAVVMIAIMAVLTNGIMATPAAAAPLLDDPTPTPCTMAGDLEFELDGSWGEDDFSGVNSWNEIIIDTSGSTGQFTVTIDYHGYSARDWFGGPDPIASNVQWNVYSGSTNVAGQYMQAVAAGNFGSKQVVIPHLTIYPDSYLKIQFYFTAPAHVDHAWLTIDSITFDGLVVEMPCQDCNETDTENMDSAKQGLLLGTDEVGHVIDLTVGETYLLYTSGGPWNDGADDRTDAAIRFYDGAAWGEFTALADYENEEAEVEPPCDTGFLESGHDGIFFTATEDMTKIQIRVNDSDDQFTDNSGDLFYYLNIDTGGMATSCAANWSKDNLVGSAIIDATWDSYFNPPSYPTYNHNIEGGTNEVTEAYYALTITGSYQDNGSDSDDILIANQYDGDSQISEKTPIQFIQSTEYCIAEYPDRSEYYGRANSVFYDPDYTHNWGWSRPKVKALDGNSNYADNSGSIAVDIHTTSYTAPVSDCSEKYTRGTWLDSVVILANSSYGLPIPIQTNGFTPGQVYYIETQGSGFSANGTTSWGFQVGEYTTPIGGGPAFVEEWQDETEFFDCSTPLDESHTGYYFTATEDQEFIGIRANPSGFPATNANNTGSLKINIYGAIPDAVPEGDSCGDWFSTDTLAWKGSVNAAASEGTTIDHSVFTPGEEYLIKVIGPAYTDGDGTGKTSDIRRAAPGSGSVSYEPMADWDGSLCYEQVTGYDHVYFRASELSDYEIRATDAGDGNNLGTMYYEVYTTGRDQETVLGCELEDYGDVDTWFVVKERGIVDANNDGSVNPEVMANELTGDSLRYKIEVEAIDALSGVWELQVSTDSGGTWVYLEDWVDCYVDLSGVDARGYFTTPKSGGPFLLRVYDAGGDWQDNEGGVKYKMWVDSQTADPGDLGDFYETISDDHYWSSGCTAQCLRPSWLQVGQMLEYARCRLTRWLAWCPWHNTAISQLQDEFKEIEAVGVLFEVMGLGLEIRNELGLYEWGDGTEGGGPEDIYEIQAPRNYIFAPGEGGGADIPLVSGDSVWGGGDIDLGAGLGADVSYSTECDSLLADSLGDRLGGPVCFGFNVIDRLGLITWVQWLWDIGMIIWFFRYIKHAWIDPNTSG